MNNEFKSFKLNDLGRTRVKVVKQAFDDLLNTLYKDNTVPTGRYLSIVKTKLEEACFFAVKGVSDFECNQKVKDA